MPEYGQHAPQGAAVSCASWVQVRVAFVVLASDNSMKGSVEPEMLLQMLRLLDDPAFQVLHCWTPLDCCLPPDDHCW